MKRVPQDREEYERALDTKEGTVDGRGFDPNRLYWRQFAEAATPKAFCQSWLSLQCHYLKHVICAMVLLGPPDEGPFSPIAFWPDAKRNMTHLTGAFKGCCLQCDLHCGGVINPFQWKSSAPL
jgi:hypothetical protein